MAPTDFPVFIALSSDSERKSRESNFDIKIACQNPNWTV